MTGIEYIFFIFLEQEMYPGEPQFFILKNIITAHHGDLFVNNSFECVDLFKQTDKQIDRQTDRRMFSSSMISFKNNGGQTFS